MTGQSNKSQGRGHDRLPKWNPKNGGMLISQPISSCLTNHSELCTSRLLNNQPRRISIFLFIDFSGGHLSVSSLRCLQLRWQVVTLWHYPRTNCVTSLKFCIVASVKENTQSSLSVCLYVSNVAQKLLNGFAWNFQGRMNRRLNFGGDPNHESGYPTLVRRALAEVWTVPVLLLTLYSLLVSV